MTNKELELNQTQLAMTYWRNEAEQLRAALDEMRDALDTIIGNSPLWEIAPDDKRKANTVLAKYPKDKQ